MTGTSSKITRRKFMLVSSVAIASPLLLNAAGSTAAGKTAETKKTETSIAKGTRIYFIGDGCVGCQACKTLCPAKAIRYGECRDEIDQNKCIHCGACYRECPVSAISETEIGAPYYEEKKNTATKVMDCDLVVLGAGGAGLVAAVKAADVSGKKVIILEKARKPGGATNLAGGMGNIKDSKWQKDAGYQVSEPRDLTGQFFDWMVSKGGAEKYFRLAGEGGGFSTERGKVSAGTIYFPSRIEKYKDLPDPSIGPGRGGTAIVDMMVECCQKQGIQILYETPARKFITDDRDRVTGVLADSMDGQVLINCSACVIASGGFGRNYEKLRKYWPEDFNNKEIHNLCPPGMTGDGIDMAEEIGAYIDQTKWDLSLMAFMNMPVHVPYAYSVSILADQAELACVNLNGERWYNEANKMSSPSLLFAAQPKAVAYFIANDEIIEKVGPKLGEGRDVNTEEWLIRQKYREEIDYEVAGDDEGASGSHVKKANTLAELALKMKIDPGTFVATIEKYNRFCDTGKDLDFGKDAKYLMPIRKPPFYAIFGHRFSQCTKGMNGIAVNSKFEVIDKKGETMPGLYAAGDTCTIYGTRPPFIGGGGPMGPSASAAAGAPGGAPAEGRGGGPGSAPAAGVNILSAEATNCSGSSAAIMSGYYVGMGVGDYLKNS
jgi:fumarate reductase flavoprotein subunit